LLLIWVGVLNLRTLRGNGTYSPKGWKSFFLPARLKNSSHPLSIVLIGVLFAMVFDTNTQAAAWAYTATSKLSTLNALFLGLSFSAGMIFTDTLDSRILFTLMRRSVSNDSVLHYRKKLGRIIVYISFIVGGYKILNQLIPSFQLSENLLTLIGVSFFSLMLLFYATIYFSGRIRTNQTNHGNQGSH
jgi:nickel/cobalt transporter (NiCoT) family protein